MTHRFRVRPGERNVQHSSLSPRGFIIRHLIPLIMYIVLTLHLPHNASAIETHSVVEFGADGVGDDTESLQKALDFAVANPCRLDFPASSYTVSRTLVIRNPGRTRTSGPIIEGRGAEATTIKFTGKSGPLFDITGVIAAGQFLHDLSFERIKLVGSFRDREEHAIQMMGCYAPCVKNVSITGFGGDGIRVNGNLAIDSNPDFTATIFLSIEGCFVSRIGGTGFVDNHPIGCPSVSIQRTVFNLCGTGGALIASAGFLIERTAFAACGWTDEQTQLNAEAIGLQIKTPGGSLTRGLLRGCEFDCNRGEHLRMDNFGMARLENNRFIYADRFSVGVLCPPIGANMAPLSAHSVLNDIVIDGLFHRVDVPGDAIGIKWSNSANVDETSIEVVRNRVTNSGGAKFVPVEGTP